MTFHRNAPNGDPYGRYTDKEYDELSRKMLKETGSPTVYGGVFGNPEASFWCKSKATAKRLTEVYGQHGTWDHKNGVEIINPKYDPSDNPIGGK